MRGFPNTFREREAASGGAGFSPLAAYQWQQYSCIPRESDMDTFERIDELRKEWVDQYVRVNPARPELARFKDIVGRVVTVNYNGKALIDFQDGGWYDLTASTEFLTRLDPAEGKAKYKNVNSAQPIPGKSA